jgi:hypothetical protein
MPVAGDASEQVVLDYATRTATTTSSEFRTPFGYRGVKIYLDLTAITGGPGTGIQVRLQGASPVGGGYFSFSAAPTAIAAIGLYLYTFYPSAIAGGFTVGVNQAIDARLRVLVNHADATPYNYAVGASFVQ